MKKCMDIIADYRRTLVAAESLEKEIEKASRSFLHSALFDAAAKSNELQLLRIECKILYDNARRALVEEVLPAAVEIWNSYAGKKCGPKTLEKIRNETQEKTGCRCCFTFKAYGSGHEFQLSIPYGSKINFFGYGDFEFSCKYENGEELFPPLSEDNKIQAVPADSVYFWNCGAYCEDTRERAREIVQAWESVKAANAALEKAMKEYNDLIPGKMERVNRGDWLNYLKI